MTEHVAKETMNQEATVDELKAQQKAMQEKAERKRLEGFWWGAVIIWAGIIFIADYLDILPSVREASAWSWIFLGAGAFGLVGAIFRAASDELPNPTGWDYFWSALFLIIGASGFFGGGVTFPIVLIVIGITILGNVLYRRE